MQELCHVQYSQDKLASQLAFDTIGLFFYIEVQCLFLVRKFICRLDIPDLFIYWQVMKVFYCRLMLIFVKESNYHTLIWIENNNSKKKLMYLITGHYTILSCELWTITLEKHWCYDITYKKKPIPQKYRDTLNKYHDTSN